MVEIRQTAHFTKWLNKLRDKDGRARILLRLRRMEDGHFGDVKPIDVEISELRFHFGAGYRVYFARQGDRVIFLLAGGDKDTQERDIRKAREMLNEGLQWED